MSKHFRPWNIDQTLLLPPNVRDFACQLWATASQRCGPLVYLDANGSWQKGGVENANGRLRRWLPRQIDIDRVSDEEIQDIVVTANLTPRKGLGFKTTFQAILKELGKDVQIRFA